MAAAVGIILLMTLLVLAAGVSACTPKGSNCTVPDACPRPPCPGADTYPLFLSPLIKKGCVQEAQAASRVNLTADDIESYSGFMTVNEQYGSNMFFWFFPAETKKQEAPVLLWLNGGPGRESTFGVFMENGPYQVTKDSTVTLRNVSWTRHFSMLYVDNPVDTGYSFTKNSSGLSRSMKDVSENLYSVLVQFFQMFPEYSENDFYIGGQSYAGKYVPSLGYYIHERNNDNANPPDVTINFKGIYLGGGFCDPLTMMPAMADFLFNVGVVSDAHRRQLQEGYKQLATEFHSGIVRTTTVYSKKLFAPVYIVGLDSADNLLGNEATNNHLNSAWKQLMSTPHTRISLHAGVTNSTYTRRLYNVRDALSAEFLTNTTKENAFLMDNYKVLHYSGNLDVIVNVPMTEAFLDGVQWKGQDEYRGSHRQTWYPESCRNAKLSGWYVQIGNFTRVIVRNSGHMTPYDQPEATLDMMKRFIFDEPFNC